MAATADGPDLADQVCEVVVTAPDAEWLASFTRQLVEDGLIAAAHHLAEIRSIYRWQGDIYDRPEARAALHTRLALVPTIVERVRQEHPYEVPAVAAVQIVAGNPDYAAWILAETASAVTGSAPTTAERL